MEIALEKGERKRLILVEDDSDFALELTDLLFRYGFDVFSVDDLAKLRHALVEHHPDVLILDQFVNGQDLLAELSKLRDLFSGGIVMLTGNRDTTDRILGLEGGVDDFVLKTTEPRELVARVRAVIRRLGRREAALSQTPAEAGPVTPQGQWKLDRERRRLSTPHGELVDLTGMEFDVLLKLYEARGTVVSRDTFVRDVLRRHADCGGRSIENLISRIRIKMRPHLSSVECIKSIRGQGYVFVGFE